VSDGTSGSAAGKCDNVLLLGAGFSRAAGVPLMADFVERMWEYAARGMSNGKPLSPEDVEILARAKEVWTELDSFHGRAEFDDRNIEDILSLLSFNVLAGETGSQENLEGINKAISRTIELACTTKHPGLPKTVPYTPVDDGPPEYRTFWTLLLERLRNGSALPAIITTNYDLVLERSLFQVLMNTIFTPRSNRLPFEHVKLCFHNSVIDDPTYDVQYVAYTHWEPPHREDGTILKRSATSAKAIQEIELLKLHGSLSFPKQRLENGATSEPVSAQRDPDILPPIFNKLSTGNVEGIWRTALNRLRTAKNVVVVGYSLPRTDIYMQYFLKAALGPNRDLNRISFFDPMFWQDGAESSDMEQRYRACFSPQVQKRLLFRPRYVGDPDGQGTLSHFLSVLASQPELILF